MYNTLVYCSAKKPNNRTCQYQKKTTVVYEMEEGQRVNSDDTNPNNGAERRTAATNDLLRLFPTAVSRQQYLNTVVQRLQTWSGCRHSGIRIRDRFNNIPLEAHTGYDATFLKTQGTMSLDTTTCICPRVILAEPDPEEMANISPEGSYYGLNSVDLYNGLDKARLKRYRGVCPRRGYATLVVSPIKFQGKHIGAIHLADERPGLISKADLLFIEAIAPLIGEAIHRFKLEEELRSSLERQVVISEISRSALEDLPQDVWLERSLDLIFNASWLGLVSKVGIFLYDAKQEELVLQTQKGFSPDHLQACRQIPLGKCLCGRAAQTRQLQYAADMDTQDEIQYESKEPYCRYCVPMVSGEKILGAILLYLSAGYHPDSDKETFLLDVANIMAIAIEQKRTKAALIDSRSSLAEARRYVETGRKKGNVDITVEQNG